MLLRLHQERSVWDNLKLGVLTAFSAGMVNVTSLIVFFVFTSNVTGHYAVLAQEIANGNWIEAAVVLSWIVLFFVGNVVSNLFIVIGNSRYLSHAMPLILEVLCFFFIGIYLQAFYAGSLQEMEVLVSVMLFAMGLQNGLTASVSNMALKTTHLTGLTTDLAIVLSMMVKREHRDDPGIVNKAYLLIAVLFSYLTGGVISGLAYLELGYGVFFVVSSLLSLVILYDLARIILGRMVIGKQFYLRKSYFEKGS